MYPAPINEKDLPSTFIRHNARTRTLQFVSGDIYESALIDVKTHRHVARTHSSFGAFSGDIRDLHGYLTHKNKQVATIREGYTQGQYWCVDILVPIYTVPGARRVKRFALRDSPDDPLLFEEEGELARGVVTSIENDYNKGQPPSMRVFQRGMFGAMAWNEPMGFFQEQRAEHLEKKTPTSKKYFSMPSTLSTPDGQRLHWRIERDRIGMYTGNDVHSLSKEPHNAPWAELRLSGKIVSGKLVDALTGMGNPHLTYGNFQDDVKDAEMLMSFIFLDHYRRMLFHYPPINRASPMPEMDRDKAMNRYITEKTKARNTNLEREKNQTKEPLARAEVLKRLYDYRI
ncbi:hypothetical protein CYLTODRAFT_453629 [Cylindrobasidium torrendii FP15055 ss-10]|uniref:Uncharacterized protein n=1 Tax=Cylindrobasidium torrendii FP15055 ss-10 TaxID=1314674 RepID=A0A0D7BDT4_9AGAR|nr:hypothetical protein CYLTODRAFT_453629 [Cylindrobasidium torrendii FP15055 ss-10]